MKKYLNAFFVTAALTGCAAHIGRDFDIDRADAFKIGVTTMEEAKAILGEPLMVETSKDGEQGMKWSYSTSGPAGTRARSLVLIFDKDGKMTRVGRRYKMGD